MTIVEFVAYLLTGFQETFYADDELYTLVGSGLVFCVSLLLVYFVCYGFTEILKSFRRL